MAQKKNRKTRNEKIAKVVIVKAREWAQINGMKGKISISEPIKEDWGWRVEILGVGEKDQTAHARFDLHGNPTLWETHV